MVAFNESYRAFEKKWYGSVRWIGCIVGGTMVSEVEKQFVTVGYRYLAQDMAGYREEIALLRQLLERIREGERLTVDNIL